MREHEQDVRAFIVENFLFGQDDPQLGNSDSLLEAGVIDSTGVLELVGFLEKQYEFAVDDQDLTPANLDSVERICRYIQRKTSAQPQINAE